MPDDPNKFTTPPPSRTPPPPAKTSVLTRTPSKGSPSPEVSEREPTPPTQRPGWAGVADAVRFVGRSARYTTKQIEAMRVVSAQAIQETVDETSFVKSLFENIKSNGDPIIRNLLSQVVNLKTILDTTNLSWANAAALNRLPLQIRGREHLLRGRLRGLLGRQFNEDLYRELLRFAMDPWADYRRGLMK